MAELPELSQTPPNPETHWKDAFSCRGFSERCIFSQETISRWRRSNTQVLWCEWVFCSWPFRCCFAPLPTWESQLSVAIQGFSVVWGPSLIGEAGWSHTRGQYREKIHRHWNIGRSRETVAYEGTANQGFYCTFALTSVHHLANNTSQNDYSTIYGCGLGFEIHHCGQWEMDLLSILLLFGLGLPYSCD